MMKRKNKVFTVFLLVASLLATSVIGVSPQNVKAAGSIYWPVPGHTSLSQGLHDKNAIDISDGSIAGATVIAALGGKVTYIHRCGSQHSGSYHTCNGFGTGLVIQGTDGRNYQYAHMQAGSIPSNIQKGSTVSSGQMIGKVGTTGNSTGNHLHFGICYGNYWEGSGNPRNESYIYGNPSSPQPAAPNVSFADFSQNAVWETNAEMYIKVMNPNRAHVSAVGCYLYDANGGLVKSYSESCSFRTSYVNYTCNFNNDMKFTLQSGTTYKFVLYAIVDGKEYRDIMRSFTTKESIKPVVTAAPNKPYGGDALVETAQREYNTYHGQAYNYQYGSSPWCCNFVSWCARQAGISASVIKSTATVQTMYDDLVYSLGATVVTSPQKGDLVFYKYTNYDSARFHHIGIMTGATETIQGNVNNTWWKGKPDALKNIKEIVYVRPAYNGEYVAPTSAYFAEYSLNKTEDYNAEVYIKVRNPNREKVSAVGCELYDESGSLLKQYSENCSFTTSYVNYTCNFNSDMGYTLSPGTTYKFKLYAIVAGRRIDDSIRSFTTTGEKPRDMEQGEASDDSVVTQDTPKPSPTPRPSATPKPMATPKASHTPKPSPRPNVISKKQESKSEVMRPSKVRRLVLYSYKRKIIASWDWDASLNRTGYQIQYARNKSFTKGKKTKKLGYYKSDVLLKKVKRGKKYYVRIRGINRVNGVTKYGSWSKIRKIKVR